ncbi:MAG TPA: alpha-amylase family glycosyl hydrolase, partial [Labilithrix sp.]|nr:alpha-amylase family glycosyl hydrolase [Labilithrix sp.]
HAVFYEVNVRSFQDSNGDGIGDLAGLTTRLDYLKDLGVDALWLMPIFPSAFKDSGYDISDYRAIDPAYGDLAAFDRLVSEAHARKMRVFVDLVLNHTSDQHAWFQESRANKTNAKADWYLWSDTPSRADLGTCKPDNPRFGTGWSKDETRGQFFFHRYYAGQPDLNYRNPEVVKETLDIARFWLDRGTDGFRCDVIGKLFESPAGCDMLPETIGYIQQLRSVLDAAGSGGGRAMVAEPSELSDSTKYYGNGSDMFHMTFDFGFGYFWGLAFGARDKKIIDDAITTSLRYPKGAQPAQVLGSHDVPRAFNYTANEPWRHRNAALLEMTLRGSPFVYYGEELGMRPGTQIVVDDRDAQRTPMTWTAAAGHGFSNAAPWIAFGDAAETTAVDVEDADPASMLTYYRQLLAFRRGHAVWGTGDVRLVALDTAAVVSFVREDTTESYLVAVNLTDEDQEGTAADPLSASGTVVFGDGTLDASGGSVHVKIPARSGAVFRIR